MLGRHGTLWQVTVAIAGLAIVGVVLVGPRARERATMITDPSAIVAPNSPIERVRTQAADPAPAPAAPSDQAPSGPGPAAPGAGAGVTVSGTGASGGARATSGAPPGALPSVPAVSGVGQTLFSDTFQGDPLGRGLPAGWRLDDVVSSASSGGGLIGSLPLVGSLLGGGGGAPSLSSLLPSLSMDGGSRVLVRQSGAWSHLSAGSSWGDFSASAGVKPLAGTGFAGVSGRVLDAGNFLTCGIRGGSALQLLQVVDGQQQLLGSRPLAVAPNVFHVVQMTMQGGQVSCAMDGVDLLRGTSSLSSGRLGLVALGDLASEFDDVRAIALP